MHGAMLLNSQRLSLRQLNPFVRVGLCGARTVKVVEELSALAADLVVALVVIAIVIVVALRVSRPARVALICAAWGATSS